MEYSLIYTNIQHLPRKILGLSVLEYCLCDMIYHLSNNTKYGGWCIMSKNRFADELGLTKQAILNIISRLEKIGLVEKDPNTKFLKTTEKWYINAIVNRNNDDYTGSYTGGKESLPKTVKKVYRSGKESLPNNNNILNNNIIIDKDINTSICIDDIDIDKLSSLELFIYNQGKNIPGVAFQIKSKGRGNYINIQKSFYQRLLTKINEQQAEYIMRWVSEDDFWKNQIGSVEKLLKKNKDGIPYYVYLIGVIKSSSHKRESKVAFIPGI